MIEMIMRLFEARAASIETAVGRSTGALTRDEFIAAAAAGCRSHPIGWHLLMLDETQDEASAAILIEYLVRACGSEDVARAALAIIMRRPLPAQLDGLIYKSPYYMAERRRASVIMEQAKRAHRVGDNARYVNLKGQRDAIMRSARDRVADEILQSGRCPKCRGTGQMERKHEECRVCNGTGSVVPDINLVGRQLGPNAQALVSRIVDCVQIDRSECVNVIARRINAERDAA